MSPPSLPTLRELREIAAIGFAQLAARGLVVPGPGAWKRYVEALDTRLDVYLPPARAPEGR